MLTDIKKYTGYRIRTRPLSEQPYAWKALEPFSHEAAPIMSAAMKEPFFCDDVFKGMLPADAVMLALKNGEVFLCFADGTFAAYCSITNIIHERSGQYDGWAMPNFRTPEGKEAIYTIFKEVADYAFAEWPAGLGLKKLKADVCAANTASLITSEGVGFKQIGISPLDCFHNGQPYDSVLLELLNPKYFGLEPENISDEFRRRGEGTSAPGIHTKRTGAGIRDAAEPGSDSATGIEREASDPAGELSGGLHGDEREGKGSRAKPGTGKPAAKQRPAKSRSNRSIRDSILSTTDKPADPISESGPKPKRRKLR